MVKDGQNQLFALKRIKAKSRMTQRARASYENEIDLMKSFRGCPRIVQLYDSEINAQTSEVRRLVVFASRRSHIVTRSTFFLLATGVHGYGTWRNRFKSVDQEQGAHFPRTSRERHHAPAARRPRR